MPKKTNKEKLSYTQLNKLRLESLAKGRQTALRNKEQKKKDIVEEKEKINNMNKDERVKYLLEQDNRREKENRNKLRGLLGTTKILDKFKTNLDNIDLRASKAKNTLMVTVYPTKFKPDYTRKTIQNFGNNLSKYFNKLGLKGNITLETNFSEDDNLVRPGRMVNIGRDVEFYDPVVMSGATEADEKLIKQYNSVSSFSGAKFFIDLKTQPKHIKSKLKNI
jgi:hypothetical protein